MKLSFIGGGKMAEAIIHGVIAAERAHPNHLVVGDPVSDRREYLAKQFGVHTTPNNSDALIGADMVVLAVKPQDLGGVMQQLRGALSPEQAAVSIIAGAKMSTLTDGLRHSSIIRVMPNTPAQVGCGMSLWTCSEAVTPSARRQVQAVLSSIGQEIYVADEKYMDMATALSASGPAYVFLFVEALIDAGVYVGLPRDMARALALQTVYGSARLLQDTGRHPAELRDLVTSPGGTTAEALRVLEQQGVPAAVIAAVDAAYRKSVRLGEG